MPTVTVATAGIGIRTQCIDVLQLTGLEPSDGTGNLAPGTPIIFDLLNSAHPRVHSFSGGTDDGWTRLLYDDGWTHSSWNDGTGDEWDVYDDDGNYVYRAQGQATSLLTDYTQVGVDGFSDTVTRVKWFTGATAGVCGHVYWSSTYMKQTYGIYCIGAEIDSGGLRLVKYRNYGVRTVVSTSSFTPADGTWYWIRLQHVSLDPIRIRAKYWTGGRLDEPPTWNLSWASATEIYWNGDNKCYMGYGCRCHAGTAYFDDFEAWLAPDPAALAKLTVTVNGIACTVANGRVTVRYGTAAETWDTYGIVVPKVNLWRVEVTWADLVDALMDTVTIVVDYGGVELSDTDFSVTRIPGAWPTYDPATDSPSGDPDRMSWFELESATLVEPLGAFCFFRTIFPLSYGYQDGRYTVAMLVWPTSCQEDFLWLLYTPYYTPVDGRYLIGHPVYFNAPASVVSAIPVHQIVPSDVIPRGSLERLFPSSIVPQAYMRKDFPANVITGYVFHYEGASSGVVGAEVIRDLDGSGLVFQRRVGTTIHVHGITSQTYQKLVNMGVVFATAHIGRINVRTVNIGVDTDEFTI